MKEVSDYVHVVIACWVAWSGFHLFGIVKKIAALDTSFVNFWDLCATFNLGLMSAYCYYYWTATRIS